MQCWSNHSLNKADTSPKSPFLKCKLWYCREHTITVLSLNGFAPFVIGLKKRVRTIYYKQLLIVGCRVWENQRIFFCYWCSISSILGKHRWPDIDWISSVSLRILKDQLVLCSDFQNTSKKASQLVKKLIVFYNITQVKPNHFK